MPACELLSVTDPGFPQGGGGVIPPRGGGREHYNFAQFSEKLHKIERIWMQRGGTCVPHAPLRSATACSLSNFASFLSERKLIFTAEY